jgi:hypothetical protein
MPTYRVEDGPNHVIDDEPAPIPGHYEAVFRASDGTSIRRYLTDKGRAELLVRLDEGDHEFSADELRLFSVVADLDSLVARMEHESGDGA